MASARSGCPLSRNTTVIFRPCGHVWVSSMKIRRSSLNLRLSTGFDGWTMTARLDGGAVCTDGSASDSGAAARNRARSARRQAAISGSEHEDELDVQTVRRCVIARMEPFVLRLQADPWNGIEPRAERVCLRRSETADERGSWIDVQPVVPVIRPK